MVKRMFIIIKNHNLALFLNKNPKDKIEQVNNKYMGLKVVPKKPAPKINFEPVGVEVNPINRMDLIIIIRKVKYNKKSFFMK